MHLYWLFFFVLSVQFPNPHQWVYASDGVSAVPDQRSAQRQQQKPGGRRLWQHATATHGFPGWKVSGFIPFETAVLKIFFNNTKHQHFRVVQCVSFPAVCVILQVDTVCHCMWEDCIEACAQGAVEDCNEQPGEDHCSATGQRHLCKPNNIIILMFV